MIRMNASDIDVGGLVVQVKFGTEYMEIKHPLNSQKKFHIRLPTFF